MDPGLVLRPEPEPDTEDNVSLGGDVSTLRGTVRDGCAGGGRGQTDRLPRPRPSMDFEFGRLAARAVRAYRDRLQSTPPFEEKVGATWVLTTPNVSYSSTGISRVIWTVCDTGEENMLAQTQAQRLVVVPGGALLRRASTLGATVRSQFPGLTPRGMEGAPPVFADGASGSQVHGSVVEAMSEQLRHGFANVGGGYTTADNVGLTVDGTRSAMADFINCHPTEVAFGASMTALTFHLARALHNTPITLGPGDEVALDPLSHNANVSPWVQLALRRGATVRWLPVVGSGAECTLATEPADLAGVIVPGVTKLVAVGAASNGTGTVHDVARVCAAASDADALSFVDAVHYAPHHLIDVQKWRCDFLVCSPYKFFGPHSGVLFGRRGLFADLRAERLELSDDGLPCESNGGMSRWELGTQNHEALSGVRAAVEYLAGLGAQFGGASAEAPRRERLAAGVRAIEEHEAELKGAFLEGVEAMADVRLLGVRASTASQRGQPFARTPTFAIRKEGVEPDELARRLVERGVWCTAGNHYAGLWSQHSGGLATTEGGGMARLGFLHYNTCDEVERALAALREV